MKAGADPRWVFALRALLLAGAMACGLAGCVDRAPPLSARLIGFRALLPDGGEPVPLFDPEARPVMRVEGGVIPFTVRWTTSGSEGEASVAIEEIGEAHLVRVVAMPAMTSGRGVIVLRDQRGSERRWPFWWDGVPDPKADAPRPSQPMAPGEPQFTAMLWSGVNRARAAQASGDTHAAVAAWVAAAEDAERLGVRTEVGRRLRAAAYVTTASRRAAESARLLARAAEVDDPDRDPVGHARLRFSQGHLAYLLDDWRAARRAYEESIAILRSHGEWALAATGTEALANLLADLGDESGAAMLLKSMPPDGSDAARRARYETNLGWFALRAQESALDPERLPALRVQLAVATAAFAPIDDAWTANAATNEAWAALLAGDHPAVHQHLAEAARLDPAGQGFGAPYAALVGARLALAEGRFDAAAQAFAAVEAQARRDVGGGDAELGWRARFGAGQVARARGDGAAAVGHFMAALGEVERLGLRAGVRGDRAVFHADRRALVEETVALLVAEGRVDEAFGVADGARVRPLRALKAGLRVGVLDAAGQARWAAEVDGARGALEAWRVVAAREGLVPVAEEAAWQVELAARAAARDRAIDGAFAWLDAEAPLSVPSGLDGGMVRGLLGEDEVLVAFGPGAWAFRVDRAGVAVRQVGAGEDLLGAWRGGLSGGGLSGGALSGVGHVYLVAGDRTEVFALPTAEPAPLLEAVGVSFLPYAGVLATGAGVAAGAALVVADPRGDLAQAAAEGRGVAAGIAGARLLSGRAASLDAVLAGLATAPVFHFAGHGVLRPESPWDAHLRLAGVDRLGLAEVLTHPVGARLVVLSGCETGTDAVLVDDRVVGLPEAFLAAGARSVVATDRRVDDGVTRRFVERFYAAGGAERPGAALRVAALALRSEGEAGWSAYRLVGLR